MKISDLEECVHLAKTLNFTQTSKHFFISRPALAKHIEGLEQEFDLTIFSRGANGIALTESGTRFIEGAERLLSEYGRFTKLVDTLHRGTMRTIYITFLYGAIFDLLGSVKRAFKELYPDVLLQFIADEVTEVFDSIKDGRADFAITSSISLPELESDLYRWEPLYEDALIAMVPNSNPLSQRDFLTPDDIRGADLVRMSTLMFPQDDPRPIAQFAREVENLSNICHDVYDLVGAKFLMDSGDYLCLTMRHAEPFFGDGVTGVAIEGAEAFPCTVGAVWKRAYDVPEIDSLVDILRNEVAQSPLRGPFAVK